MNNKLPKKYEKNFLGKMKLLFFRIFNRRNVEEINPKIEEKKQTKDNVDVFRKMHNESSIENLKIDIIEMIDKKPDLIKTMTIPQLKALNNMYDKIIEENARIIRGLERKISH